MSAGNQGDAKAAGGRKPGGWAAIQKALDVVPEEGEAVMNKRTSLGSAIAGFVSGN